MNRSKQALIALFMPTLLANFSANGMEIVPSTKLKKTDNIIRNYNPQRNENALTQKPYFIKKAMDEILQRPFNHKKCPVTVKLSENPKIGYMDSAFIKRLSRALPVQEHDPFVTTIAQANKDIILRTMDDQVIPEREEYQLLLNKLPQNTPEKHAEAVKQAERYNQRMSEIKSSANLYINGHFPFPAYPVKYLQSDDSIKFNDNSFLCIDFKEDKELKTLMDDFKSKPSILFCELTPQLGEKIRNLSNEERLDPQTEATLIDQVNTIKTNFRNKKIVTRRDEDITDRQRYTRLFLPNSDIVLYETNCHLHGENGYSEKRTRDEALARLNPNVFGVLNDREGNYKKRKINSNEEVVQQDHEYLKSVLTFKQ